MPVPIVTANHLLGVSATGRRIQLGPVGTYDGLKCLTTRRQPTSYFVG
jgi:hypothetical protein